MVSALRRQPLLVGFVVVLLLAGTLSITIDAAFGLTNFRDAGYPDSVNLLILRELVSSGHLYPDPDQPPYLVSVYGPLTYILLAIPYKVALVLGIDPQVMVRLVPLGAMYLCVFLVFLIGRRLSDSRRIAWLCALFAVSALPISAWMIRGDFLALGFALFSLLLLLRTPERPQIIGAAICAGMALLIKQTFLAAPVAVFCWLIYRRRFKAAALWGMCIALTVAGGYAVLWWREPLMLKHFAALRSPIFEYRGAFNLLGLALSEPIVPFAVIGGLLARWKGSPERLLVLIYCVVAWLVAIATIPQVGGALNYFWEPFVLSAVLAGLGLYELQRKLYRTPILVTAMLLLLFLRSFFPMMRQELNLSSLRDSYRSVRTYPERKAKWKSFISMVSGRKVLSTSPDVSIHGVAPEMPDPYLNALLERGGKWDPTPVIAHIEAGQYDLIVLAKGVADDKAGGYRGIRIWDDAMREALKKTYRLACAFEDIDVFQGMEVWLPNRGSDEILPRLASVGCIAVARAGSGSVVGSQIQ